MIKGILRGRSRIATGVPDDKRLKPYKHLASSVMGLAFNDAEKKACSALECVAARRFLCSDSWLLRLWCLWLDIHPDRIRAEAGRRGWSKGVGRSFGDRE
ncbi:MAG TPA: hypothetical protein VFM04_04030 [Candidatus Methylomirabilis sp.]|nr:hypothetical protein [Candidatus Methylomirabilis sp.]